MDRWWLGWVRGETGGGGQWILVLPLKDVCGIEDVFPINSLQHFEGDAKVRSRPQKSNWFYGAQNTVIPKKAAEKFR